MKRSKKLIIALSVLALICLFVFVVLPILSVEGNYKYEGNVNNIEEGLALAINTLDNKNLKVEKLIYYSVGYLMKDLDNTSRPIYYEFEFKAEDTDTYKGYRLYIDLKNQVVMLSELSVMNLLPLRPYDEMEVPDREKLIKALQVAYGSQFPDDYVNAYNNLVIIISSRYLYEDIPIGVLEGTYSVDFSNDDLTETPGGYETHFDHLSCGYDSKEDIIREDIH